LPFLAVAEEVSALRRNIRAPLTAWGLSHLIETAHVCVSELVANVITHIGPGTPTTVTLSRSGTDLRIEVRDPEERVLPVQRNAAPEAESGRGLALVDALTHRWGVTMTDKGKTTWCELGTGFGDSADHQGGPDLTKTEALLMLYARLDVSAQSGQG
jgi:anti-sigma regulatory factor (Ser/Thr protein kinase)